MAEFGVLLNPRTTHRRKNCLIPIWASAILTVIVLSGCARGVEVVVPAGFTKGLEVNWLLPASGEELWVVQGGMPGADSGFLFEKGQFEDEAGRDVEYRTYWFRNPSDGTAYTLEALTTRIQQTDTTWTLEYDWGIYNESDERTGGVLQILESETDPQWWLDMEMFGSLYSVGIDNAQEQFVIEADGQVVASWNLTKSGLLLKRYSLYHPVGGAFANKEADALTLLLVSHGMFKVIDDMGW